MAKDKVKLVTPPFVIGFPSLFSARAGMNEDGSEGQAKFSCAAIWTPANFTQRDKELWKAIKQALDEEAKRAFKSSWADLPGNVKRGLRDGREKADLEGFGEGTVFATLSTHIKPGIVDITGRDIIDPNEIFAGCICRATVSPYSYQNKGKGLALGLRNIQLIAGEGDPRVKRIDGRGNAAEDFGDEQIDSSWLDQNEGSADDDW